MAEWYGRIYLEDGIRETNEESYQQDKTWWWLELKEMARDVERSGQFPDMLWSWQDLLDWTQDVKEREELKMTPNMLPWKMDDDGVVLPALDRDQVLGCRLNHNQLWYSWVGGRISKSAHPSPNQFPLQGIFEWLLTEDSRVVAHSHLLLTHMCSTFSLWC